MIGKVLLLVCLAVSAADGDPDGLDSVLEGMMKKHLEHFKTQALVDLHSGRSKRAVYSSVEVAGVERAGAQIEAESGVGLSCFIRKGERYCVLGASLYAVNEGKATKVLDGLPVESGDSLKTWVFKERIFYAFINRKRSVLRLYLQETPQSANLVPVQHIEAITIEDFVFFEHNRHLYMAMAMHEGPDQYAVDVGVKCVIYQWLKTLMDAKYSLPAKDVHRLVVLDSDTKTVLLALIVRQEGGGVHLWRLAGHLQESQELVEVTDVADGFSGAEQIEAVRLADRHCLLFAKPQATSFYCLYGKRLLRHQVLEHRRTSSALAWSVIETHVSGGYRSSVLLFNAFDSKMLIDVFYSDSTGRLLPGGSVPAPPADSGCLPAGRTAYSDGSDDYSAYILTTCSIGSGRRLALRADVVRMTPSQRREPPRDALLGCLADLDDSIARIDSIDARSMAGNLVTTTDHVTADKVLVEQLHFVPDGAIKIQVLRNATAELQPKDADLPLRLLRTAERMILAARKLAAEVRSSVVVSSNSSAASFSGNMTVAGPVRAKVVRAPALRNTGTLNGRDWSKTTGSMLRTEGDQLFSSSVVSAAVIRSSRVLTNAPQLTGDWLLRNASSKLGNRLRISGNLTVGGRILTGGNAINGVRVSDVVTMTDGRIRSGVKTFAAANVSRIEAKLVNGRDFGDWYANVVRSGGAPATGRVKILGPVSVAGVVDCDSVNDVQVSRLPEVLVRRNGKQAINGTIRYLKDVRFADLRAEALNGVRIKDLLTSSTAQDVSLVVRVDNVTIEGNVTCDDVNGVNLDDVVYADEAFNQQTISSSVQFSEEVAVSELHLEPGATLNDVDLPALMSTPTLIIDSGVNVTGSATVESMSVRNLNGFDPAQLDQRFWTKSTDQEIRVQVRMPDARVRIAGDVTVGSFLGSPLDAFYHTDRNETVDADVLFDDAEVIGRVVAPAGRVDVQGVELAAIGDGMVRSRGNFSIAGVTRIKQLRVVGNLNAGSVNGLNVPDDVVLLDRQQTLHNSIFTDEAEVRGSLELQAGHVRIGRLNGANLTEFVDRIVFDDQDVTLDQVIFDDDVVVDDLTILRRLGPHNVTDVLTHGLRLDRPSVPQVARNVTVHGNIFFQGAVNVSRLNDMDAGRYFGDVVDVTRPQRVTGRKWFRSVSVDGDARFGAWNGRRLDFDNLLSANGDQDVGGQYEVDSLSADLMEVKSINGYDLSEFVSASASDDVQVVTGPVEVAAARIVADLTADNVIVDQCSLPSLRPISDFSDMDELVVLGDVTVPSDAPLLGDLLGRAVRTDTEQVISGKVTIGSGSTKIARLEAERVGSVPIRSLIRNALRKTGDQNVSAELTYSAGVDVESVGSVGKMKLERWNGRSVREMIADVVRPNDGPIGRSDGAMGRKVVRGGWVVRSLNVTGAINGVKTSDLVRSDELRLPESTFHDLTIKDSLKVQGLINNYDLEQVMDSRIPLGAPAELQGDWVFESPVSTINMDFASINDLTIEDLVLRTAAPGQQISGTKTIFADVDFAGDVTVDRLNGEDPEQVAGSLIRKDQDLTFQDRTVHFKGGLDVIDSANIAVYNGQNLTKILTDAMRDSGVVAELPESPDRNEESILRLQRADARSLATFAYLERWQRLQLNSGALEQDVRRLRFAWLGGPAAADGAGPVGFLSVDAYGSRNCSCRSCADSALLTVDWSGRLETLSIPRWIQDLVPGGSLKWTMFRSGSWMLLVGLPECSPDGASGSAGSIVVLDALRSQVVGKWHWAVDSAVRGVAVEGGVAGGVFVVVSHEWAVDVFLFDGSGPIPSFKRRQVLPVGGVVAMDMCFSSVLSSASSPSPPPSEGSTESLFLALAVGGVEAESSVWRYWNGSFHVLRQVTTVGAVDVVFSVAVDTTYLTFAQDPPSVGDVTESWSQYSVPAQVLWYTPVVDNFYMFQQLDMDRVSCLANMQINGSPFLAAASSSGRRVRIYRAVRGQGFAGVQDVPVSAVESVGSFTVADRTYLAVGAGSTVDTHRAVVRGATKPIHVI